MKQESIQSFAEVIECMNPILTLLSENQRIRVLDRVSVVTYRKHEKIYECGASPDHLLCVLNGKVKIFCEGVGGRSQIMRVLAPGEFFGYRASMAGEPYVTAAKAFETSSILMVPMPIILGLIEENNAVCRFFVQQLATDLGISDQRTVSLTQKHMRGRMAEAILYLEERFGLEEDNKTLAIQITREDLSELCNMTTANAIRTLSSFVDEGVVRAEGRRIHIENHEQLVHISTIG